MFPQLPDYHSGSTVSSSSFSHTMASCIRHYLPCLAQWFGICLSVFSGVRPAAKTTKWLLRKNKRRSFYSSSALHWCRAPEGGNPKTQQSAGERPSLKAMVSKGQAEVEMSPQNSGGETKAASLHRVMSSLLSASFPGS